MQYLIRRRLTGSREFGITAHYWNGKDTVCKLWSNRKMRTNRFVVMNYIPDSVSRVCINCSNGKPFKFNRANGVLRN